MICTLPLINIFSFFNFWYWQIGNDILIKRREYYPLCTPTLFYHKMRILQARVYFSGKRKRFSVGNERFSRAAGVTEC